MKIHKLTHFSSVIVADGFSLLATYMFGNITSSMVVELSGQLVFLADATFSPAKQKLLN